jgi:thioredoxin-dependent peroxiredoxin
MSHRKRCSVAWPRFLKLRKSRRRRGYRSYTLFAFQRFKTNARHGGSTLSRREAFVRMWMILVVVVIAFGAFVVGSRIVSARTLPTAGTSAPDFSLTSQDSTPVSLKQYRGKWVALYFYPKDQTPGCTMEAHNFQRDQPEFARRNAVVLGVSVDSADSHKRFCSKEGLNFKLLADTSHAVSKQYGSLINFGVAQISARNTFLIDPEGRIAKVFAGVNPEHHSAEVLAALDELETSRPKVN